ncbi:MAG: DnaJ domain-containing protein [Tatlockia sp.]|nr:DnaJ domain-containing protein [Tatlockia sp.]
MPNHYEILELKTNATAAEIRASYKRVALRWHPDKNGAQNAKEKFQQILEAYEVLSNPISRRRYDDFEIHSGNESSPIPQPKNYPQRKSSPVNKSATYPKAEPRDIPKPFDWKTFIWKKSKDQDKIKAMEAFAQEVNTTPSKALLPDWIEFGKVDIRECETPPDNNGPYIDLELREIFEKSKAKIPVKLESLLRYRDSRNRTIFGKICNLSIISLIPEDKRYSTLWPSDALFEDSPLRYYLRDCHESWSCGEVLLRVLNFLPAKHQILVCKNYFESIGPVLTMKVVDKLQKLENNGADLRLCTAMSQLRNYQDVLEKESETSTDSRLNQKKEILAALFKKINYQEASLDNMHEALNHLDSIELLKESRNFWDPRLPKSYSFFNGFKVAIETLTPPKATPLKRVLKQTKTLQELNSQYPWKTLKNENKEEFLKRFQAHVNNNTPQNEMLLLPRSLEYCNLFTSSEEDYKSTTADTNNPFWHIIPSTSKSPAMVQLTYFTAHKTGKIIEYQGHRWEKEERDKKLTFNLNLNHLLQYKDASGRGFFREHFDLVLEHIPEEQRFSLLMQRDNYGKTKLLQIFLDNEKTSKRILDILPLREQFMAVNHIIQSREDKQKKEGISKLTKNWDLMDNDKALKKLFTYFETNPTDNSLLNLFKIMQKLIQYQSVLEQQILKSPSDLLVFEKYRLLKSVLEKIQEPKNSMETIQRYLAEVLANKRTVLETRRHWFNPSTPKTFSYLLELQEVLNNLNGNLENSPCSHGKVPK